MPQQKLDLLKLTARGVAQPGARAATVMGRQAGYAGARGLHHVPDHLFGKAIAPDRTPSRDATEDSSFGNRRSRQPAVHRGLDPIGHRDGADVGGFAHQIHNGPMVFALLQAIQPQVGHLGSAQSAADQECKNRPIPPSVEGVDLWGSQKGTALLRGQPVSEPHADLPGSLHAWDARCQIRAEQRGVKLAPHPTW